MEQINIPIKELLKKESSVGLAFVENLDDKTKFAQLITSLSNSEGGILIIGVNSKKKIKGINPEDVSQVIFDCNNSLCLPTIDYSLSKEIVGRFFILKMTINKGTVKSFVQNSEKFAYYRIEGVTVKENKVLKMLWLFKQGDKKVLPPSTYNGVLSLITENISISLSQLYRKSNDSKSDIELIIAFLLYEKRIVGRINSDIIKYSIL